MRVVPVAFAIAVVCGAPPAIAQYTDNTIRIGVMSDMSGTYADLAGPGSVWAAKKAVDDFGGSVNGIKVEVLSADLQNKPDIASNIARQWYDVEKVDVIIDLVTSSAALAVSNIANQKNRVAIVTAAATSDLTGKACNANTIHWTYDSWAMANATGNAVVKTGGDSWFFLTADYALGHALERDTGSIVERSGGRVVGKVRHPFPGSDFSSFLLQAQSSKAKVIGLANAGSDTTNAIKQAAEFGIVRGGQNLAGLLVFITDIHALGLKTTQGLVLTEAWYWNANDANRAFAKEYAAANGGRYPTMVHAGAYSAVTHYLKAVAALKSDADGAAVVAKMKEMPTDDRLLGKGIVRADGRKIHDMYLFEVKKPEESKEPWDYYKTRATIPADQAFRPLEESNCPLVKR